MAAKSHAARPLPLIATVCRTTRPGITFSASDATISRFVTARWSTSLPEHIKVKDWSRAQDCVQTSWGSIGLKIEKLDLGERSVVK